MESSQTLLSLPCAYGKYELLSRIGAGAMAEIYLARSLEPDGVRQTRVIKRLHPCHAQDAARVELFVQEAELAAGIHHENIVEVFELGRIEERGEIYIAMEYVPGRDLKDLLRLASRLHVRIPSWLSVHIACQVLEGLAHAHALRDDLGHPRNIVHCDVSPENVFVSRLGHIKLGDFGVASDDARLRDPLPGTVRGKLAYLAPERIDCKRPDAKSDVFSTGVVLWECLAQKRLFSGRNRDETIAKLRSGKRTPPSTHAENIPAELDAVALAALERDPKKRLGSAREMQSKLLDILTVLRPRVTLADVKAAVKVITGPMPDALDEDGSPRRRPQLMAPHIPMPGSPGAVETSDVVAEMPLGEADHEGRATSLVRRDKDPLAPDFDEDTPVITRWHSGLEFGLWLKIDPQVIGPRTPNETLRLIRELAADGTWSSLQISHDRTRWMSVERFGDLVGETFVPRNPTLPPSDFWGNLTSHSLVRVIAELVRRRRTGRLVLIRQEDIDAERVEIAMHQGRVVSVSSSHRMFRVWDGLLAERRFGAEDVYAIFHRAVAQRVPVDALVSAEMKATLRAHRGAAIRDTLIELFGWSWARFGFQDDPSVADSPLDRMPVLPLFLPLLLQVKGAPVLLAQLSGRLGQPLDRTAEFDTVTQALELPSLDVERLRTFGNGQSLRASIAQSSTLRDEQRAVALAYLLTEMDLLLPKPAQIPVSISS